MSASPTRPCPPLRRRRGGRFASVLAWLALAAALPVQAERAEPPLPPSTVRICDDANEWPPYTFAERRDGQLTGQLMGYSVELIRLILQRRGVSFAIELLPWKRCLMEVRDGTRYQMLLNASATPERERDYLLSTAYHQTHSYVFYDRKRYPRGLSLKSTGDLQPYTLGGIRGYAYPMLSEALRDRMLRTGSYPALFRMLQLGRVDVLVEDYEAMRGLERTGALGSLDAAGIEAQPLPGTLPLQYHMMFSRDPRGSALRQLVNEELARLQQSGELQRLQQRYLPKVP
ncbi:substrate-binding periplasmic protein [Roseateles sp. DB2]|uniref:substrate-binding periplasmic protein n=1 Tax=Roseateles sp. DB2 TaxID=3453717 RepID=UPI003EEA62AF